MKKEIFSTHGRSTLNGNRAEGLKTSFEVVRPGGGFYVFPKSPIQPAARFVELALEHNVLVIPGNVFSEGDTHFRISYARSEDTLARAVRALSDLADQVPNRV